MQFAVLYQVIETLDRSLNAKDDTVDAGVTQDALEALGRAIQAEPPLQKLAKRLQWTVKHAGDPNLAKRLSRLDSQVNNFISNELSSREWKSDLAALRNGVAHGLDSAKAIVTDAGPLWTGAQLIELLFEIRVLICFGFDQEQASKIVKSNARWYGRMESLKSNLHSLRLLARAKI